MRRERIFLRPSNALNPPPLNSPIPERGACSRRLLPQLLSSRGITKQRRNSEGRERRERELSAESEES